MLIFSGRLLDSPVTFIVLSVTAVLLLLFVRRVIRWTIRFVVILVLICAIIGIAVVGYWQNWYSSSSAPEQRTSPSRRATPAQH